MKAHRRSRRRGPTAWLESGISRSSPLAVPHSPVPAVFRRSCACGGYCPECEAEAASAYTPAAPAPAQVPAPVPAPAAPAGTCLASSNPKGIVTTVSDLFQFVEESPPCMACPNSDPFACPKLADKIFPPVMTGPVQFSWQTRFLTFYREEGVGKPGRGKNRYVVQKIEKSFDFKTAPPAGYNFTPVYWEAFELEPSGQTEIDHWQFEIPDGSSGAWSMSGTCYVTEELPDGMSAGTVPEAQDLPSSTTEPKRLGRVTGTRQIGGSFDFTKPSKVHSR